MTVETTAARQRWLGNGSSSQFDFTFPYLDDADIRVIQKVNGTETPLILGAQYSITRVGAGGRVNLGAAFVNGGVLAAVRDPAPIQGASLLSNDAFFLETIEKCLDRAAMTAQRHADLLARAIVLAETDLDGAGAFQARNNRLSGLAAGVNANDAATIAQLSAVAGGDILVTPEVIQTITASVIGDPTLAALFSPINVQLGSLASLIAGLDADIDALSQIAGDPNNIVTLISNEQTARIAADTALAATVSKIGALSGDSLAFILNLNTAKVSSTETLGQRLTGIAATLAANAAAILDEQTTRASADSAIAASIITVQSQLGANTATVQTIQSSVNGILAKYVVKVDNNGYISGFGLVSEPNNGSVVSAFVVLADQFRVANPGNPSVSPFFVNGGVVYLKNVVIDTAAIGDATITNLKLANGSVNTAKIAPASVTEVAAVETAEGVMGALAGSTEYVVASVSLTATGAPIVVQGLIGNNDPGTGCLLGVFYQVKLYRNGTLIKALFPGANSPQYPVSNIFDVDTPAAGAVTYQLRILTPGFGLPNGNPQAELSAIQYKR